MDNRGCGCANGVAAIIILMVAALVGVGYYEWHMALGQQARQAAAERREIRTTQLEAVANDLDEAESWLARGEPEMVLTILRHMDEKLQILASAANAAGDTEPARRITMLREPVHEAVQAIEAAGDDEDRSLEVARKQLVRIHDAFSRRAASGGGEGEVAPSPSDGAPAS